MSQLRVSAVSVIVIVLAVILVSVLGSNFSAMNRDWFEQLQRPTWQPPNWAFGVVWTTIYILTAISVILAWNVRPQTRLTYIVTGLFVVNGILNVGWSAAFFGNQMIVGALIIAYLLLITVLSLMALTWRISKAASLLLLPYAIWGTVAILLNSSIYWLN